MTSALPPRLQRSLVVKRDRYEEGVRQLIVAGTRTGEFVPCDPALAAQTRASQTAPRTFSGRDLGQMTANEVNTGLPPCEFRELW